ncbi:MAG: endonuclease/exonuclease/phosphatase family protein [Desulfobacterales bacterium]|nr:endonuclease/exonuclease/phosphatase family protein [Desulfobacterales bacterium]
MRFCFVFCLAFFVLGNNADARIFKFASYNVEALFDIENNGTEYPEYVPNSYSGWNKKIFKIKIENIARVIQNIEADIIALQEIESKTALIALCDELKTKGSNYPYYEIDATRGASIRCAIISKFPIIKKEAVYVDKSRNILKATIDIDGKHLIIFVNHWKSKKHPESSRIVAAKALKKAIDKLDDDSDFILCGDFNSNYNEYKTLKNNPDLDDTKGKTGINHILCTIHDSKLVNEKKLISQKSNEYLYNLWLEIKSKRRWSYNFFGKKGSLDNIIVSKGLYDNKGISYIDNSFDKFTPNYLFYKKQIYRWQISDKGKGRHLGKGYSDHLPIFAYFSTESFKFKNSSKK